MQTPSFGEKASKKCDPCLHIFFLSLIVHISKNFSQIFADMSAGLSDDKVIFNREKNVSKDWLQWKKVQVRFLERIINKGCNDLNLIGALLKGSDFNLSKKSQLEFWFEFLCGFCKRSGDIDWFLRTVKEDIFKKNV